MQSRIYLDCILLGYLDSNQEKQDQNLLCYHYTIAQCFLFSTAKVQLFYEPANFSSIFYIRKILFFLKCPCFCKKNKKPIYFDHKQLLQCYNI